MPSSTQKISPRPPIIGEPLPALLTPLGMMDLKLCTYEVSHYNVANSRVVFLGAAFRLQDHAPRE